MQRLILIIFILFIQNFFVSEAWAIKIGLQDGVSSTIIAASDGAALINNENGKTYGQIASMKPYKLRVSDGNISIQTGDKYYDLQTKSLLVVPDSGFVSVKRKWYRGSFVVIVKGNELVIINDVDLESYIKGVVPSEMPSRWNDEALKAQAIAARSYALANRGKRGSRGYDLKDTPEDQAYGGASAETAKTNRVVEDTLGIVLTYNQHIIPAYYHASSGGETTNSGGVWGGADMPFLRSVPSFDSQMSKNGHGVGMSQNGANNLASKGYNAYQILTYFYNNISFGRLRPEWNF